MISRKKKQNIYIKIPTASNTYLIRSSFYFTLKRTRWRNANEKLDYWMINARKRKKMLESPWFNIHTL